MSVGPASMLQNLLTKAEIPANNLAYTLSMLEIECVIVREAVWISTASLRTDPAATTTPPLPPSFNKYVNLILKTNLVTLLALRADIPMAPLTVYNTLTRMEMGACSSAWCSCWLPRLMDCSRSSSCASKQGIATREDKWVWNRLKERALLD